MIPIIDDRISFHDGAFEAKCTCGNIMKYKYKESILNALKKGRCIRCKVDYRNKQQEGVFIHNKKWSCKCFSCGKIRSYTRKAHAVSSYNLNSRCKKCSAADRSNSASVGWSRRVYNKYMKSAISRGITWDISEEYMRGVFNGKCALTGWDISTRYNESTASLDRINSNIGYIEGNIQWVHSMVNMSKNKYSQDDFINMCSSVHLNMIKGS